MSSNSRRTGSGAVIRPSANHTDLVRRARVWERELVPGWEDRVFPGLIGGLTIPEQGSVLIAECRTGYLARLLADHLPPNLRCIAVDPVPEMLDMARSRLLREDSQVWWDTRGVENLPYQRGVFGASLCASGVLTKEDLLSVGPELARVTRPMGHVGMVVPLARTFSGFYELFREALVVHGLLHLTPHLDAFMDSLFDEESLRVDLAAYGVRDVEMGVVSWDLTFESGEAFLMSAEVGLLYLPYWLQIVEDDAAREQIFFYVRSALDTYFHGIDITMSAHVAWVVGVAR
jgi:hypothetical protein